MFVTDSTKALIIRYQLSSEALLFHYRSKPRKELQRIGVHVEFDFVYKLKLIIMISSCVVW